MQRTFGDDALKVQPHQGDADRADVALGERRVATIAVDDDRSFSFEMRIPLERQTLEPYLRLPFDNGRFKVVPRAKKTDSVALNLGSDFPGVSADDPKGKSSTLQMAILDHDLEDFRHPQPSRLFTTSAHRCRLCVTRGLHVRRRDGSVGHLRISFTLGRGRRRGLSPPLRVIAAVTRCSPRIDTRPGLQPSAVSIC